MGLLAREGQIADLVDDQDRITAEHLHEVGEPVLPHGGFDLQHQVGGGGDPQVIHQNMVVEVDHPELGRIKQLSNPLRMDSFEGRTVRIPPPGLGQHSRAVLDEFGYTAAEIDGLIEAGVVGVVGEQTADAPG